MITVTIDNIPCQAKEGEYLLNVARRNRIFIPALCYVNGCSPTLACRLCLVDVDGKRAYACNAKAKEGMSVVTKTEEIEAERKAIMQVYDINHPLECGVCDQSGECELQNYTLEMGVDHQAFAIQDTPRPSTTWGKIHYDASLCIVCERCVTVCKDKIGESALKTVPRGGEALDKEWKEKVPKDAFAMWNKMQKSLIGPASGDTLSCSFCGECVQACPVGALVSADFQYRSNAWELRKIPASNPHSSDCSLLYYEVKHANIDNPKETLYRVSTDKHFSTLNGAARYGYDFENTVTHKDEKAFNEVVEALRKGEAKSIVFNSFITNEEALLLQKLKETFGVALVNPDAKAYQRFLEGYAKTSGKSLYGATTQSIKESDFIITLGTAIKTDAPNLGYALNNALLMNKGAGLYFHPIADAVVAGYSKNIACITHKVGTEEAALLWILGRFGEHLPQELQEMLSAYRVQKTKEVSEVAKETFKETVIDEATGESKEVEKTLSKTVTKTVEVVCNTLWEVLGVADMEEQVDKLLEKKERFSLMVGEDLYTHPNAANLSALVGLIARYTPFDVLLIPSQTNTLGVALVCTLDTQVVGKSIGYNEKGDWTLSALGKGQLDMPALNQQEGTFTNLDKRVVPTNAALEYHGYCLNDIANALGIEADYTVAYTEHLPEHKGFQARPFDTLPNVFANDGTELRGYALHVKEGSAVQEWSAMAPLALEGELVYLANPVHQFSPFTNKAHQLNEAGALYASAGFLEAKGFKDGQMVRISNTKGHQLVVALKQDPLWSGAIPYLPTFDIKLDVKPFFEGYRFAKVSIEGVTHE